MIEVKNCPYCHSDVDAFHYSDHKTECSSKASSPESVEKTEKTEKKSLSGNGEWKIFLNAELLRPYTFISKLNDMLLKEVQNVIDEHFLGVITRFNFYLNEEKSQIIFSTRSEGFSQDSKLTFQFLVEQEINSYEVIALNIDSAYQQYLPHLSQKFLFEVHRNLLYLISKKQDLLSKIIKFFQDLTSLSKIGRKISLESQILQIQEDKEKELDDIIKSIHMFIENVDQVMIKIKIVEKKCLVFISGVKETVEICKEYIQENLSSGGPQNGSKRYRLTEQQQKILLHNKILESFRTSLGIKYEFKTTLITRNFQLSPTSIAYLIDNTSILAIPKSAVIIVSEEFMREVRGIQESVQCLREYAFFSGEGGVQETVKEFIKFYVEGEGEIAVILPATKKEQFLEKILQTIQSVPKTIKLYILDRSSDRTAVQYFDTYCQTQTKWYIQHYEKKIFYPEPINTEIQTAITNGLPFIIITHRNLNLKNATHTYIKENGQIVHIKEGRVNFVEESQGKLVIFLQDDVYIGDFVEGKKDEVIFAAFELDVIQNQQRNLVTGKKHKIAFEKVKKDEKKKPISQDGKNIIELIIKYPDIDSIDQIWSEIRTKLYKHQIVKQFSLQGISKEKRQEIQNWCKLNKIEIKIEGDRMTATSFSQAGIGNLEKLMEIHQKKLLTEVIQYPTYWLAGQKQELCLYNVKPQSEQFRKVQQKFKVGPIKKLQRIQNTLLFQKYSNQKQFLAQQNGTKPRQLMLYHGTRLNPPQAIYNDRQESFNINYANMGSYGKGIYFAKNSQYSNNYCYQAGAGVKQMFYCLVLAGVSELWTGKQTHNTGFRDEGRRIRYESVVSDKAETIVVVFKNRRAYPLYLISY